MRTLPCLLLAPLALSMAAPLAARSDALDQSSVLGEGQVGSISVNDVLSRAQTFTVGASGLLTRVRVALGKANTLPGDTLVFDVRPTTEEGAPVLSAESALGVVVVPEADVPDSPGVTPNFDVDFSGESIFVTAGEELALVARSAVPFDSGRTFAIIVSVDSSYAGGDAWLGFPDWILQSPTGPETDWIFETYVPEPDGALAAALAALAVLARARTTRRAPRHGSA